MKIVYLYFVAILLTSISCKQTDTSTKKHHKKRDNIVNVKNKIVDIKTKMLIGRPWIYVFDKYLIVCDTQNPDKGIHLFDKNTYEHIASTGVRGKGPQEIIRYGHFGFDDKNKLFYVIDHGKVAMFQFNLDSILTNPNYMPIKYLSLNGELFPTTYDLVNDSTIIGSGIDVIDYKSYNSTIVKCNILTGDVKKIGEYPSDINPFKLSTFFALSVKQGIYVESYSSYDLMSICDLDGEVIHNIYGPQWETAKTRTDYYYVTKIMRDKIIAAYKGHVGIVVDEHQRPKAVSATKFLIFSTDGDYLKTLETNHDIRYFGVDEGNNRIIINFQDRAEPLGYIDLNGIVD